MALVWKMLWFIIFEYPLLFVNSIFTLQIMIVVLFVFKERFNHIKCTKYETFAENDSGTICIKEIKQLKMYTM